MSASIEIGNNSNNSYEKTKSTRIVEIEIETSIYDEIECTRYGLELGNPKETSSQVLLDRNSNIELECDPESSPCIQETEYALNVDS